MALIETDKDARRLARAIASDLSLYNEEKIVEGIERDNLFEAIAEEIEEGRAHDKSRVSPDLYQKNIYERAIVDILVKSKGHSNPKACWVRQGCAACRPAGRFSSLSRCRPRDAVRRTPRHCAGGGRA